MVAVGLPRSASIAGDGPARAVRSSTKVAGRLRRHRRGSGAGHGRPGPGDPTGARSRAPPHGRMVVGRTRQVRSSTRELNTAAPNAPAVVGWGAVPAAPVSDAPNAVDHDEGRGSGRRAELLRGPRPRSTAPPVAERPSTRRGSIGVASARSPDQLVEEGTSECHSRRRSMNEDCSRLDPADDEPPGGRPWSNRPPGMRHHWLPAAEERVEREPLPGAGVHEASGDPVARPGPVRALESARSSSGSMPTRTSCPNCDRVASHPWQRRRCRLVTPQHALWASPSCRRCRRSRGRRGSGRAVGSAAHMRRARRRSPALRRGVVHRCRRQPGAAVEGSGCHHGSRRGRVRNGSGRRSPRHPRRAAGP